MVPVPVPPSPKAHWTPATVPSASVEPEASTLHVSPVHDAVNEAVGGLFGMAPGRPRTGPSPTWCRSRRWRRPRSVMPPVGDQVPRFSVPVRESEK